jgi:hypothetical protein
MNIPVSQPPCAEHSSSVLEDWMEASLAGELSGLCHDAGGSARAALRDASLLARREGLIRPDMCAISEDGVLSLQWERGVHGFMVVFSGDGEGSFSSRHDETFYSYITDFYVEAGLPPQGRLALDRVLRQS